jgi:uncharacterized protein YqfB (UPF0267 family)
MKGILFKPQFTPLVLSGQKTMTRRVIKDRIEQFIDGKPYALCKKGCCIQEIKPRYQPGEIVYVKEAWGQVYDTDRGRHGEDIELFRDIVYRADNPNVDYGFFTGWKSPLMMPAWASRCKLQILSVRVEQLQEITEEDAISEGCGIQPLHPDDEYIRAIEDFACLWDSISKEYPWSSNPLVFVYEFKPVPSSDEA